MVLIDDDEGGIRSDEFMKFCQGFMRVGNDLGKPLDLFRTENEIANSQVQIILKNTLGVDIKKPASTEVYKVNDAAHFHEWAEHMKREGKDIGQLDLILICIPDRDHDETYQSIKVLTELNYGKIRA